MEISYLFSTILILSTTKIISITPRNNVSKKNENGLNLSFASNIITLKKTNRINTSTKKTIVAFLAFKKNILANTKARIIVIVIFIILSYFLIEHRSFFI